MDAQHHPALLGAAWTAVALLALAVVGWRIRMRRRARLRRAAGYRLIDCLKAYAAWMDWQRDEPLPPQNLDELATPAPLQRAVEIKDRWFPELGGLLARLLQSHGMMVECMWERNILRIGGGRPEEPRSDVRYREAVDLQDATLDALFLRCRQLIGEGEMRWHRTRSDFSFSSAMTSEPSNN